MLIKPTKEDLAVIKKLDLKDPWIWLATWFGFGLLRPAPGTWGSLGALPFGLLIYMLGGPVGLLIAIIIISALGYRAAQVFAEQTKTDDHAMIVVDEVAGQWIPLLITGLHLPFVALAFILFRLFDITKIWPVCWFEKKLPGALGVMADDTAAGIYALLCLSGLRYAGFS